MVTNIHPFIGSASNTMGSFYRSSVPLIASEYDVRAVSRVQLRTATPEPPVAHDNAESQWIPVRKAKPANVLLPGTRKWLEMLSADVQPQALANKFPRLANRIAADWGFPEACRAFTYDLLVDRRGGRLGFPKDVLQDILALRALYSELHPENEQLAVMPPG